MREPLVGLAVVGPMFVAAAMRGGAGVVQISVVVVASLVATAFLFAHWGMDC